MPYTRSTMNFDNNLKVTNTQTVFVDQTGTQRYYPAVSVTGSMVVAADGDIGFYSGSLSTTTAGGSALAYNTDEIWFGLGHDFYVGRLTQSFAPAQGPQLVSQASDASLTHRRNEGISWSGSLWWGVGYVGAGQQSRVYRHSGSVNTANQAFNIPIGGGTNNVFCHIASSSTSASGDANYPSKLYAMTEASGNLYVWTGTAWGLLHVLPGLGANGSSCMIHYSGALFIATTDTKLYNYNSATASFITAPAGVIQCMEVFPSGGIDRLWAAIGSTIYQCDGLTTGATWLPWFNTGQNQVNGLRAYNGKLYAFTQTGGRVYRYDPLLNSWIVLGNLFSPAQNQVGTSTVLGGQVAFGKLYVYGVGYGAVGQNLDIIDTDPTTVFTVSGNMEVTGSTVTLNTGRVNFLSGNQTILVSPTVMESIKTVTTTYTASLYDKNIVLNTTAAPFNVQLFPALSGSSNGLMLRFRVSGSNSCSIFASGSDVVNTPDSSSIILYDGQSSEMIPSSSFWFTF